jgi:RimJ/RimL family protein N-acetyltransferase
MVWRVAGRDWARPEAFLCLNELISIIHADNGRSRRVAAKLGMTLERLVCNPGVGREAEVWSP